MSRFINSFRSVPLMLFRLSAGQNIKLRDQALKKKGSYDLLSEHGKVQPKALDPSTYSGPNGASMRPVGKAQSLLVENFNGKNIVVYAIPEGTLLPHDLILVHEHSDHYSLQAAEEMTVEELNTKITDFMQKYGTIYTKDQWRFIYEEGWQWSDEHQDYFRYMDDGSYEWYSMTQAGPSSSQKRGKEAKKGKK